MKIRILTLCALLLTPAAASAREIQIGASIPLMTPIVTSATFGVGLLPRFSVGLSDHIKLSLDAGMVISAEAESWKAAQFPVLLGAAWLFGQLGDVGRPFINVLAGYTYARDGIPDMTSNHWLTVGGGGGVNIPWGDASFMVGFNLVSPDVRGGSPQPLMLMVNLGVQYALSR